ncbi:MAG: hypothetical protein EBR40_10520 [Proteobacteria bacterium]|nr:hypothetical protein [Pseudomonadota bacterium]
MTKRPLQPGTDPLQAADHVLKLLIMQGIGSEVLCDVLDKRLRFVSLKVQRHTAIVTGSFA